MTSYAEDWTELRYSDFNLRRMCDEGAARVYGRQYEALNFDVYNTHERDVVEAHMSASHPAIKFTVHRLFA